MSNSVLNNTSLQVSAVQIVNQQSALFNRLHIAFQTAIAFFWSDPTKAQAAFDALQAIGSKGSDIFANAAAYSALYQIVTGGVPTTDINGVTTITGGAILPSPVPAGWSYTINADGSVTVIPPTS